MDLVALAHVIATTQPSPAHAAAVEDVAAADYVAKTSRSSVGELGEALTEAAAARYLRVTNKKI